MSVGNTIIPEAVVWHREILFINVSVLFYTELKTKGKRRREKRRAFTIRSSSPSVLSSLPSLAAVCHLSLYEHEEETEELRFEDETPMNVGAAEDAHNQMLELQSQPTPEGNQPLSEDEICDQSTQKEIGLQAKLNEALERIEMQDRNHQALASQVERKQKLIEDFARAQQGPSHDL
ncbi:hypothetical protein E6C27_scaffold673G001380 [Cucumis melo var. makuwa]|uniref:Uncharacterized protein n=1 Tax=Cucumis melo var. makuwa TaxID=1194695 RepID=A0A5A7UAX4_CUCMM|nr:hypothetical protein E6C27_scaffold673G001380 [Cucumis melo var. makuwa]